MGKRIDQLNRLTTALGTDVVHLNRGGPDHGIDLSDLQATVFTDVDFNGNNLINVGYIESNATNPALDGVVRMGSTERIGWRNAANTADIDIRMNSDEIWIGWGGSYKYQIGQLEMNFTGNSLTSLGSLEFTQHNQPAGTIPYISWTSSGTPGMSFNIKTTPFVEDYLFNVDGVNEYAFNNARADFLGNNLINVGYFESDVTNPATVGEIRLGYGERINWRNLANNNNNEFAFGNTDKFLFKHDDVITYSLSPTEADWLGNNLRNVGYFEDNSTNPSTSGSIRLGYSNSIGWRNSLNTNNVTMEVESYGVGDTLTITHGATTYFAFRPGFFI
jgi:hypothetical protein